MFVRSNFIETVVLVENKQCIIRVPYSLVFFLISFKFFIHVLEHDVVCQDGEAVLEGYSLGSDFALCLVWNESVALVVPVVHVAIVELVPVCYTAKRL